MSGEGREARRHGGTKGRPFAKPTLRVFTTTLWEYPSQHYESESGSMQGDKAYAGATPSWVIWQLLQRYTRENDLVVDPMCGSGTTIDVARDLKRRALGYDLTPSRPDIFRADARKVPLEDGKADFVFIDPPYSTHIEYSNDPADIGKLDAKSFEGIKATLGSDEKVAAYNLAMSQILNNLQNPDKIINNQNANQKTIKVLREKFINNPNLNQKQAKVATDDEDEEELI